MKTTAAFMIGYYLVGQVVEDPTASFGKIVLLDLLRKARRASRRCVA